jgi:hypothetical protein
MDTFQGFSLKKFFDIPNIADSSSLYILQEIQKKCEPLGDYFDREVVKELFQYYSIWPRKHSLEGIILIHLLVIV